MFRLKVRIKQIKIISVIFQLIFSPKFPHFCRMTHFAKFSQIPSIRFQDTERKRSRNDRMTDSLKTVYPTYFVCGGYNHNFERSYVPILSSVSGIQPRTRTTHVRAPRTRATLAEWNFMFYVYWNAKITYHFSNAFNLVLILNFCILKVTDAILFKFMLPIYN